MLVKCEKCGGDLTVAALRTSPQEVFVIGTMVMGTSPVEARVCLECGYVSLYAQNPNALRPHKGANEKTQYEVGEFRSHRGNQTGE